MEISLKKVQFKLNMNEKSKQLTKTVRSSETNIRVSNLNGNKLY